MAFELYDSTYTNLETAIIKATKRQAVIAQNIANINNPDYQAMEFNDVLDKAVKRSNKTVVFEEEMADMAKKSGAHSAYLKLLSAKLGAIRTVVTQGRK